MKIQHIAFAMTTIMILLFFFVKIKIRSFNSKNRIEGLYWESIANYAKNKSDDDLQNLQTIAQKWFEFQSGFYSDYESMIQSDLKKMGA